MYIGNYLFKNPEFFWFLIIVPILVTWFVWKYRHKLPEQKITSLEPLKNTPMPIKARLRHLLPVLRILAVILFIIALARPQTMFDKENVNTEGIDIVLALDVSSSMLARDFRPDRLEAAKKVAAEFVEGRPGDRIGLVTFSAESFTQCPITTDHSVLLNLINDIESGILQDGTAIGLGLATSIDRLRNSPGKSKVVILLTDGVNNSGFINPLTAAEIAKQFNVRVYTIGVGSMGTAPYPVQTPFGMQYQQMEVQIDEALLKQIAEMTGVKYYRATNNEKLKAIYTEIDQLEKSKVEITSYRKYTDKYLPFGIAGLILLALEFVLRTTVLKFFP
jgi:Ca-activated chloride channel homolog